MFSKVIWMYLFRALNDFDMECYNDSGVFKCNLEREFDEVERKKHAIDKIKKELEGKAVKVCMIAGLNKFLRIYYARVKEIYKNI